MLLELPAHLSPYSFVVKEIAVLFACHREFPNKSVNSLHLLTEAATTQYIIQVSYVSIDVGSSYFFHYRFCSNY